MNSRVATRIVVLVGVAGLAVAGCGDDSKNQGGDVNRNSSSTATVPSTATTAATTATTATTTATTENRSSAARIVVPNVVGKDLQLGQDTMQAAGLYKLKSHDSTGAGRLQILDRNWVVTDQTPAPGSMVTADQLIDLGARKFTD